MLRATRAYVGRHHIGLLALFIALGGTSYAAVTLPAGSVGTKQLRRGAVTPPKVSRAAVALFRGQQGAKGDTGPPGPTGTPGSPAGSAVFGNSNNSAALSYHFPAGCCTSGDEAAFNIAVTPNATMVARDFAVVTEVAPGGVETRAVTLRVNGADTALTCTIVGSATTCDGGSTTITIPPRSKFSIKLQKSTGAPGGYVAWAFRLTPP